MSTNGIDVKCVHGWFVGWLVGPWLVINADALWPNVGVGVAG